MNSCELARQGTFQTADYDFCLFRIPKEGARVLWQITNVCNYTCDYCIFASGPEKIEGELSTTEIVRALDGLKDRNFTHIKFTGGEPFVRTDLVDILKHACDLGMTVDVSTNASRITQEKARQLSSMGLNMVHVSVDGHNREIHERVRGKNTFERTVAGLSYLTSEKMYVRIGTVLFAGNDRYLREMADFCVDQGAQELAFSIMEPAGRIAGDYSLVTRLNKKIIADRVETLAREYGGKIKIRHNFTLQSNPATQGVCPGGKRFLYIDNLGRVAPCTWVVEKSSAYLSTSDLKRNNIEEMLCSEPIQRYFQMIEQASSEGYLGCPLRWQGGIPS